MAKPLSIFAYLGVIAQRVYSETAIAHHLELVWTRIQTQRARLLEVTTRRIKRRLWIGRRVWTCEPKPKNAEQ